jgi:hypothetical protein
VRALLALSILAAPAVACAQRSAPPAASVAAASDDSVLVGCYGGVRGGGSGNKLTREGDLWTFEKPLQEEASYTLLRRDSAAAAEVFAALERARFRSIELNQIGNMTCVLELNDAAGEHTVSWHIGQPPPGLEPVLEALDRAFGDDRRMWR